MFYLIVCKVKKKDGSGSIPRTGTGTGIHILVCNESGSVENKSGSETLLISGLKFKSTGTGKN